MIHDRKKLLRLAVVGLLLVSMASLGAAGSVQILDDFEDGDFTNNPSWTEVGDSSGAEVKVSQSKVFSGSYSFEVYEPSGTLERNGIITSGVFDAGSTNTITSTWVYYTGRRQCIAVTKDKTNSCDESGSLAMIIWDSEPLAWNSDGSYNYFGSVIEKNAWYRLEVESYPSQNMADYRIYNSNDNLMYETSMSSSINSGYDKVLIEEWTMDTGQSFYWDKVFQCDSFCNKLPSISSVNISPDPPQIGDNVSYSAEASDSDSTVSSMELTVYDDGTQVYQDTQSFSSSSVNYTWSDVYEASEGSLDARFTVTDNAGATAVSWLNRTLTDTSPDITINSPENKVYGDKKVNYSVQISSIDDVPDENIGVGIYLDSNQVKSTSVIDNGTVTGTLTDLTNGSHTFSVEATESDLDFNQKETQFKVDIKPPQINITRPESPTNTRTGLPLNFTVSDPHLDTSTCKYSKDGGTNFSLSNCNNASIDFGTVGNHELTVYASDTYGNTGKASKEIFVDEVNEIRAEDQSTNTEIKDFQVTLSNGTDAVGGQAVNGSFRFNTSNAPKGETILTLKASGYTVRNETVQITDSYSLNKSFSLERAGLYIDAKDERTESDIQFNLTLSNSTNVYSKEDITQLQEDYKDFKDKNISSGDVTASVSSSGYQTREYFYSIDENSKISLTPYLLEKNKGIYVSLEVYDSAGSNIQDATLTVQRRFNGEWRTVSQKTTETTGGSSFFLDPETTYRFIASKLGYETFRGTFSPSNYQYDPLKIYLGREETGEYSTVLESVEYNVRPQEGIISGVQNFELNVTDKEAKLSSFGLKAYNETEGLEYSSIVQSSPSGGSTSLEVNTTGMGNEVTVETFFQRENETYSYKNTFRVLKPLESGEFSLIQGKRYLEKHLSMFSRSLLTILAVIGVTLPASKSKRLESNGAGAIGLAMLGTATAVNFFPQPIFILTLLPVIGIYLMRIR